MTNNNRLACRWPKVVIIYEDKDEIQEAAKIISEKFKEFRVFPLSNEVGLTIERIKPSVILFAMRDIEKSLEVYGKLINYQRVNYNHYSILMCRNTESASAFRCCIENVFNDYFVYKPLYEVFRLQMIIHNGLASCSSKHGQESLNQELLTSVNDELAEVIHRSGELKQNMLQHLEQLEQSTEDDATSDSIQERLKTLLESMQSTMNSGVDGILDGVNTRQQLLNDFQEKIDNQHHRPKLSTQNIEELLAPIEEQEPLQASRILIVEDNPIYRDMIARLIEQEGFEVVEARDGVVALEMLESEHFDLLMLDLFMPKLDGLAMTKQLKDSDKWKDLPVIALTGNKSKKVIQQWAKMGLEGYIQKPSNRQTILATIDKALNSKHQGENI